MKSLFILVLLHLCYTAQSDMNLNKEILKNLGTLNDLCKNNKVNFTSPDTVSVPGGEMFRNAFSCLGVFKRELQNLLNNITVHEDGKIALQKLKANLEEVTPPVEPHPENDNKCPMKAERDTKMTFVPYKNFIRKVNNKK